MNADLESESLSELSEAGFSISSLKELLVIDSISAWKSAEEAWNRIIIRHFPAPPFLNRLRLIRVILLSENVGIDEAVRTVISELEEDQKVSNELRRVGIDVTSVWNLVNAPNDYMQAIPSLATLLTKMKSPRVKEGIARALTVKGVEDDVIRVLISEFTNFRPKSHIEQGVKWALANAISTVCDRRWKDEILRMAADKQHGDSRWPFIPWLARSKKDAAVIDLLVELMFDDSEAVSLSAIRGLGTLRAKSALSDLTKTLVTAKGEKKDEIVKAISKIKKG
ncbi:MAG TPA: hypothetical protein VEK08_20705 [Planctomycetota bacterium]|nr:hypothetical protein [Planctomycetota bacterium]